MSSLLFSVFMMFFVLYAQAADNAELEARAASEQLVVAAKSNNVEHFKKLIAKTDLAEMEDMEKEQGGFMDMFMGFVAEGGSPEESTAEVTSDQVTFIERVEDSSGTGSGTETTNVTMVLESGEWKLGKPRQ